MTKEQEFRKLTEEAKFKAFSVMCKKAVDLEQEKCELLGIIQQKDELIKKLRRQIEKIKSCRCVYETKKEYEEPCRNCHNRSEWRLAE